jgi:hypothetical protein
MNTYSKFVPNVFLAKCEEEHTKGETITLTTKHGSEHECIVFNLMGKKDGLFYYSIVRADGFNVQEWARRKAERLAGSSSSAISKGNDFYNKSNKDRDFLSLGEPIKVGHHSESRHRKIIEQANNNMGKFVEMQNKAEELSRRASYWEGKANTINLSMPESIEYYEFELDKAKQVHEGLKDGTIARGHSYSLTYAKKDLNEAQKKYDLAVKLWGDTEKR